MTAAEYDDDPDDFQRGLYGPEMVDWEPRGPVVPALEAREDHHPAARGFSIDKLILDEAYPPTEGQEDRRPRLSISFDPRDLWVGVYVGAVAVYICPIPCVVIRWAR